MKHRLVILSLFYCIGIILGNFTAINFWFVSGIWIAVFCAILICKNKNLTAAFLLFLIILTGVLNLKSYSALPKCHAGNFIYSKNNSPYSLSGFVDSEPELKSNQLEFIFSVRQIQSGNLRRRSCGKILVRVYPAKELNYGENLILIGHPSQPHSFSAAGQSYKEFLARKQIYLVMRITGSGQIIRQPQNSGSKIIAASFGLRSRLEKIIRKHLDDLPAAILCAMVLGLRNNIPPMITGSMVKTGTIHVLVVSGFNVGIVAFIINLLLKIMRIPKRPRIILVIIGLIIYCFLTGTSSPVLRATVMGVVFISAYLARREPQIYNSLAAAALLILILNPQQAFDTGFQLSFASVFAIVYFYPKLKKMIRLENCGHKIPRFILEGFLVSSSAWLGTAGIIALNFRIISPVTIFANILIAPLAALITLCGFTLVLSALCLPGLANLISLPVSMLINIFLKINTAMAAIPFAYLYF